LRSQRGVVGVNEHLFCWASARPRPACGFHLRVNPSVGLWRRQFWRHANRCGEPHAPGIGDAVRSVSDTYAHADAHTDADTDAHTDADTDADTYADADSHTDADAHTDASAG
jgi:hypothetical protein